MFFRKSISRIFVSLLITFCATLQGAQLANAQTDAPDQQESLLPQITEATIRGEMALISTDADLPTTEKTQIVGVYEGALKSLETSVADKAKAEFYRKTAEDAAGQIDILDLLINESRQKMETLTGELPQDYNELSLMELEQELSTKLSAVIVTDNTIQQMALDGKALEGRPDAVRNEISETQIKLAELTDAFTKLNVKDASPLMRANYTRDLVVIYSLQDRKFMLEQELASLPAQQQILSRRITAAGIQNQHDKKIIQALQNAVEAARSSSVELRLENAQREVNSLKDAHPLVQNYARENVKYLEDLLKISKFEEGLPALEAQIRIQSEQVSVDRKVSDQIIGTGRVNRNYGEHLRKLRRKQPRIAEIESQIKARDIEFEEALFQSITNEEALDLFNAAPLSIEREKLVFDGKSEASQPLSADDELSMRSLHEARRATLSDLASYASLKAGKLKEVNALQSKLLSDVKALCALLDGRLLWLPSTEPIGLKWPGSVVKGFAKTFTPTNIGAAGQALLQGLRSSFVLFLSLAAAFIYVARILRARLKPVMESMPGRVGRVQKDSFILTPTAILDGVLYALPWALIPFSAGLLLLGADNASSFVYSIVRTLFVLSGVVFILSILRAWNHKNALFDIHFRVDKELRGRIVKHIPWLLATQIVSLFIMGLSQNLLDYDAGVPAFGVLGFLIGSISIAVFSIKLAWSRSQVMKMYAGGAEGIYLRNEKWFFALAILFPVVTSIVAAFGYYETARLLMTRFFISFCILIAAYVIHGFLRRTVVIAQRRLALDQARARRDQALKVRLEKVAAEERGEIPVPKLDYESIDIETINRQSSQLVNIMVFIVTAFSLWAVWSSLFPALSIFNEVNLWGYDKMEMTSALGPDGEMVKKFVRVPITLWNLIQALGIGMITWLAARNLPGFLEIFVLKRLNMAQSSRFAIVTVLGYFIFMVGVLIAFDKLGTQWSQLQWIVAAFSVGIGFGLQAIFANFISGLIILFERPVRIGDYISIGDIDGTVTRIQIRATTLLDLDNKEILIPNQDLISQRVTNWTLSNSVTRMIINVGIAYGSDTALAHKTLLETIKANPNVLGQPEPSVLFLGFGDSSLDFEIRVFLRDFVQRFVVSHEIHMAADAALREVGIEIAFPQLDLHVKNQEIEVPKRPAKVNKTSKTLKAKSKPKQAPKSA